jgi:hypothetical protein
MENIAGGGCLSTSFLHKNIGVENNLLSFPSSFVIYASSFLSVSSVPPC